MGIPQDGSAVEGIKPHSKTQNVAFAKLLAGNDKKIRDKGLKKLKKWLSVRSLGNHEFTEDELMTIWIGLYYSMWMSDMPLVQEELAESLSSLIHCFNENDEATILFIKCFNSTINQSWGSLDQYRVDKFSMLVRRFLRQSLSWLGNNQWKIEALRKLMDIYEEQVLSDKTTLGFKLHFIDIFLEELAKVSAGSLSTEVVTAILKPFVRAAAFTKDGRTRFQLSQFFRHIIKQTDVALKYEDKFQAWKSAGFPGGDIGLVVPDTDDEDDDDDMEVELQEVTGDKVLDPRAGSVHVALPQIPVPTQSIVKLLKAHSNLPESPVKSKRLILSLAKQFKILGKGEYPFSVKKVAIEEPGHSKKAIDRAAKKLIKLERKNKKNKALIKKKMKQKANGINLLLEDHKEEVTNEEKNKNVTQKRKRKKLKENNSPHSQDVIVTPKKAKKRRISGTFDVSDVETNEVKSPVGARKNEEDGSVELELPCGWIVEPCSKAEPKPKKTTLDDWSVGPSKVESQESEIMEKGSNEIEGIPENISKTDINVVNDNVTPIGKSSKRKSLRLSLGEQKDVSASLSPQEPIPDSYGNNETNCTPLKTSAESSGEIEITIPCKKKATPVFFAKAALKAGLVAKTPSPNKSINTELNQSLTGSERRIIFNLARNMAQEKVEYFEQIQRSPQIPFDSKKLPKQSALKAGLPPSPINPFYARKLKLNSSKS